MDKDVQFEENRLVNRSTDPIKIVKLHKTYDDGFQALKGISFGIQNGHIFGLLGPNGAGKSTTFNITTALIPKTEGSVFLKNNELKSGLMTIFQDVGICPQFDCLWDYLTPCEHLYLFGRMKGLKGSELKEVVEYYISSMQLDNFRFHYFFYDIFFFISIQFFFYKYFIKSNTKAINLSGGNKRKLCVANALIGGPDLQFFDEPSTGLDPIAKRYLWNTLQTSLQCRNSAIVLTTHSMTEAEFLCNRIGILINGKFVCFGSNQHLKNKFGDGYRIKIKLNRKNSEEIHELISKKFEKGERMVQIQKDYLEYQIDGANFSFYQAFLFLEDDLKKNYIIEDFSITQCSLEQIFIYFSKFQQNIEN